MYDDDYGYEQEAIEAERLDADLLQAQYTREANRAEAMRKRGICQHSSAVGYLPEGKQYYPEQAGLKPGQSRCTEGTNGCTAVFDSDEGWATARHAAS